MESLSRELVALVRRRQRAGLPAEVRDKARLHVADAIAIGTAAATRSSLARSALKVFAEPGARAPSPQSVAFGMSASIHVLDYDDIHDYARVHPTVVTLPAVIAGALAHPGSRVDPVEVVALTNEVMCRLGAVCEPDGSNPASNYFLSQLFGYFGAALAAGLALEFDDDALVSALGLASMQAAGAKQAAFGVGSNARAIYPAFAAMGGVQAALLARSGFTGPEGAFDGAAGLFRVALGEALSPTRRAALLQPEGWVWMQTHVKPWPSCRLSHPFVNAALIAHRRFRASDIKRVTVQVDASVAKLCRPVEMRRRPTTLQDAKYSIPFMIAFTLVRGAPTLLNLDDRVLADADVLAMAQRVDVDESLPDLTGLPAGTMLIESASDRLELREPLALRTDEPMVREKFGVCFDYAGRAAEVPGLWQSIAQAGPGSAEGLWRAFEGSGGLFGAEQS